MAVETYEQPDGTNNHNTFAPVVEVATRVLAGTGVQFAPHAQATPDMTVALDAGRVFNNSTKKITNVSAQNTATITAPTSNPRNDIIYVDCESGAVGVATGTEAAMSALLSHGDTACLKQAVWGSEPETLALWHGEQVAVRPGDRVRFYEPADGALIFVAIDDGASTEAAGDGGA